ncbi:MAG: tRNA (N(6)-L-threonylcarbamoyladenosine(37)-C(2))-methylthiotransferase MtaB [Spirochaetales bacterium]|nr:tRNA (N(6)-L-threonylcarbamoyladenosine(37)-C(2))-methylthiotransferase MtaB [Spirochaetales bacterium]
MPSIAFQTLGCKLNQYETESLAAQFSQAGYTISPFGSKVDVSVINTCTVTNKADRKSRNLISRALKEQPDEGLVVVTGCFANSAKETLEKDGRTFVVENDYKAHIFELVEAHRRGEVLLPYQLTPNVFGFTPQEQVFHTRGTIKIQDGCNNFCTFCIIPHVRGRGTSRPLPAILDEARTMVQQGYKELVLTGVNMSRYAWEGQRFSELLEALLTLEVSGGKDFRVRISSLEPDQLDEKMFVLMDHRRMTPHLHLCLQSGSERILLAMRRQYTYGEFAHIAEKLRQKNPLFNLTTDIILGFPGETEIDLDQTLAAVEDLRFGHVHSFPYSRRKGTRADRLENQIPDQEKSRRSALLQEATDRSKRNYRSQLVGTVQELLVEKVWNENGRAYLRGLGDYYVPIRVAAPPERRPGDLWNQVFSVRVTEIDEGQDPDLVGKIV